MNRSLLWVAAAGLLFPAAVRGAVLAQQVAEGLDSPIFAVSPPGDSRLFVAEQSGAIRIVNPANGRVNGAAFLTVNRIVSGGEQGLLGLAFHPDYASNGYLYVNVTRSPDGATEIRRYRASGANRSDPASEAVILVIPQPYANHNGGWIGFGPDGFLYIAAGDGGSGNDPGNRAQNRGILLGKMLRIDVDHPSGGRAYGIPAGNPFAAGGGAPEVWDYGLRNPWRNSFDRATGDLWIGDVGQGAREEVDLHRAGEAGGKNFGWRVFEGTIPTPGISDADPGNTVAPVFDYTHDVGQAIVGGYVCRDGSDLSGRYVFGDAVSGRVWSFRPVGGAATDLREHTAELTARGGIPALSSFGEDSAGRLYAVSLSGSLYRLVGGTSARPRLRIRGPSRLVTDLPSIRVRGTASDDGRVQRIRYRVAGTPVRGGIRGRTRWIVRLPLRVGRNVIVIQAVDSSGLTSKPQKVVVIRK